MNLGEEDEEGQDEGEGDRHGAGRADGAGDTARLTGGFSFRWLKVIKLENLD